MYLGRTLLQTSLLFALSLSMVGCGSSSDLTQSTSSSKNHSPAPKPTSYTPQPGVHINEFLASNLNTAMDPDYYAFSDWIELYNNSDTTQNISGYYLSDDTDNPTKWQFPANTTIAPHGYLIVWADKKDKKKKALHTNFKLSSKKEHLLFSDPNGTTIDNFSFKDQTADISALHSTQGILYMSPTPGKANTQTYTTNKRSTVPTFSKEGGFYNDSFTLSLEAPSNTRIYYTTDGSIPNSSSQTYSSPITVSKNMTINAVAVEEGLFPSRMVTHTYLENVESKLPVVSLTVDPTYLYDNRVGIYVDGTNGKVIKGCKHDDSTPHNFGQKWKRPATVDYFDASHNEQFTIGADIAISGECSRFYKKKSFKFNLDSKYGTKSLHYNFYPDKQIDKIKDFKIRAGNRGYEIGDILAAKIVSDGKLNIDYQSYQTVKMFMNGEYWGVYNIREKKSKNFIKNNYPDVDTDNLDIIKNGKIVKEGTLDAYKELAKANTPQKMSQLVDVDNFIDYAILEIYSGNEDWSYSNTRAWRERKPGAKWRWMLDDLDEGFINYTIHTDNLNGSDGIRSDDHELSHIFNTLMQDPAIKARFKNRFNQLLDTTFSPENMTRLATEIFNEREPYMPNQEPAKWFIGSEGYDTLPHDYPKYKQNLFTFAQQRRDIVRAQLQNF